MESDGNPGKNLTKLWESLDILWESPEIPEKTSQSGAHPRDPRSSRKKPHNLSPIAGTPENPENNLTIIRICLVGWLVVGCWLVVPTSCAEAPCGGKQHLSSRCVFVLRAACIVQRSGKKKNIEPLSPKIFLEG